MIWDATGHESTVAEAAAATVALVEAARALCHLLTEDVKLQQCQRYVAKRDCTEDSSPLWLMLECVVLKLW